MKGVTWVVAAASNLHLMRGDVVLRHLLLQDDHVARARTALLYGSNLIGPNIKEFDAKIYAMREQHSLHRELTTRFKVPKMTAPKSAAQSKASVHQRLGRTVNQDLKASSPFRLDNRLDQTATTFLPTMLKEDLLSPKIPTDEKTSLSLQKKKAVPSKGSSHHWRDPSSGLPSWFCPVLAKPTRRVSVIQDSAFGCPVGVGVPTFPNKDTHTVSDQER